MEIGESKPATFLLAMVQMRVDGGMKVDNLARAEARIAEAASGGAQVVLLPEALTLGWTHSSALSEADLIPESESCVRLSQAAKRHGVYVCAGLVERDGDHDGARIFNSAVLYGPEGNLLLKHRKIHELAIGHSYYALGDRLGVVETPLGTFGLIICADAFAPGQVIARAVAMMGADIILSPSAWAVPGDHDNIKQPYGQLWRENYAPVAADFGVWFAGVSNVGKVSAGPWAGRKCIGCSLLVGPGGKEVLMGPYGEDAEVILYANIQLPEGKKRIGPVD